MFKDIMYHELKNIIFSPKFSAAFITCSILILLSVSIGIGHYKNSLKQYQTTNNLTNQEMREQKDWMALSNKIVRKPDPMQIFSSGITDDIGRFSSISSINGIKLTNSIYSDDLIYSIFRFIDFSFIVIVVLSLLAILFTYDLINGEREKGTLQLLFSNPLPRAVFLSAKLTGAWLGLVIPVLIPLLLSILLLLVFSIPLNFDHWVRLISLFGVSILFFTFFIVLGALISTLTRRSQVSFLISLVCWLCLIFIIPRLGIITAGQLIKVPGIAEVEGQRDGYAKNLWDKYFSDSGLRWQKRNAGQENWSKQDRENFRDANMWQWMEEEDKERKLVEVEIDRHNRMLMEDMRNKKNEQEKLAFSIARFSPASAYQFAAMNLAGTNLNLKTRYEDAMNHYREQFNEYKEKKRKTLGETGGIRVQVSSDGTFKIDGGREKGNLDLSEMPVFNYPAEKLNEAFKTVAVDSGILAFSIILCFAASLFCFFRNDLR
ncbi:MAG: ABC transporter permease subunit [Methanococcaceae archaeon]